MFNHLQQFLNFNQPPSTTNQSSSTAFLFFGPVITTSTFFIQNGLQQVKNLKAMWQVCR
jgi:hypothetical protein